MSKSRRRISADSYELQLVAKETGIEPVRLAAAINDPFGKHLANDEALKLAIVGAVTSTSKDSPARRAAFATVWPLIEQALKAVKAKREAAGTWTL